ncbi:MAG: cobalamin-binding protein [SAR324 cluster bacterium]|nr:cobalamin-binding protein [SAR324 cluster bacterium]
MSRVVTLLPSATEIVCALGQGEHLVGRSHECDFPAEVQRLPACTAPNLDPGGSSPDIDGQVKSLLQRALSIYSLDRESLVRLQPDLVVTQTQCEVCAVSLADVEDALAGWLRVRPRLVSLAPMVLADLWTDIARVAGAMDVPERGNDLVAALKARVQSIAAQAGEAPTRPGVACIEWIEPLMGAGNWIPEMVAMAGGKSLCGTAGQHSPWLDWEALRAQDPDILLLMPCGFGMEKTREELHWMQEKPGWADLRAVREGRVYCSDGNHFFNRSGPRLVESLEIMAEIIHPALFNFGHQGLGWQALQTVPEG